MESLRVRVDAVAEMGLPFLLALQAVLGSLQLLDAFRVVYHPMVHRATRVTRFELGFSLVTPLLLLMVLWLGYFVLRRRFVALLFPALAILVYSVLGLEAFVAMVSLLAVLVGLWIYRDFGKFFFGVFLLLSGIEGLALLHWVVFVPLGWVSPFGGVAWVEMALFYIVGYLAPLLVLPFLFMWLLRPMIRWGWGGDVHVGLDLRDGESKSWEVVLFLGFTVLLGVVAALYPYSSAVNPESRRVGVDFPYYVKVSELVEHDLIQAFKQLGGSRPFIFIIIYVFQHLFGLDVSFAVRFLPVFLNPLLAVSIYFLTMEMFNNGWLAAWAAFFTVCGFQVTVGMYAFFLTNMLGLVITFFSLGFLFKALRCRCRISLALASLWGILLVFTHPWTFDQYFATSFLLAGLYWYDTREKGADFDKVKMILVYLASLGLADLLKVIVFRGAGGVSASSAAVSRLAGLSEFWFNSIFSFRLLYGGAMATVIVLSLAIRGVYLLERHKIPKLFLMIFLAVTSLVFLVGDETIKGRLLYNVPVGLFAAYGFLWLLKRKIVREFRQMFISFVFLSVVVYLFRSLANLV